MGIYDREYYRPDDGAPTRSMTTTLILVNVAVFVLNIILGESLPTQPQDLFAQPRSGSSLFAWIELWPSLFSHPWAVYQLVTYGFAHSQLNLGHIIFNMIGLWCFGRDVEDIYGRAEFLRIYLVALLVAGFAFVAVQLASHSPLPLLGASGAVTAVTMLYILHFPKRTILLMFVLPVPAWVAGAIFIAMDVFGAGGGDNTSHAAHLAGAAFAFVYFRGGWNFGRIMPRDFKLSSLRPRPKLRVHDPEGSDETDDGDWQRKVDEILAKISVSGESSLTAKERRTLEQASRRYQQRRR